ncbi:eCIS core domain-containing protein [Phormidesmis priestleyi]
MAMREKQKPTATSRSLLRGTAKSSAPLRQRQITPLRSSDPLRVTRRDQAVPLKPTPQLLLQLQRQYGNSYVQRVLGRSDAASPELAATIEQARGHGQPLDQAVRMQMETAFGADFQNVRIHTDAQADRLNRSLAARAFTTRVNIFFRQGEYHPHSSGGRELLAHELTHVLQQSQGSPTLSSKLTIGQANDPYEQEADRMAQAVTRSLDAAPVKSTLVKPTLSTQPSVQPKCCAACEPPHQTGGLGMKLEDEMRGGLAVPQIQRDLAIEPPNPTAVPVGLTPAQIQAAIRYNQFRFQDPYTIRIIRDVLGLAPVPAIVDEGFVEAIVQWQAQNDLPQDGKVGATTTRTLMGELTAEGQAADVRQLRLDNFVSTTTLTGPTFNTSGPGQDFVWEVGFNTSHRNGWIIQRIDNVFNPTMCNGAAYTNWRPTPRYWEAWQVDGNGAVTPNIGALNDEWTRPFHPVSHGNWSMTGTVFTTLTLPTTFTAGSVLDAGILRATTAPPNNDFLGLVAGTRRIGGEWDYCPPNNFHRRV